MSEGASEGPSPAGREKGDQKRPISWRRRLSRAERVAIAALAALLVAAGAYVLVERARVSGLRDALIKRSAAEAASLGQREAEILDLVRGFITETAAPDYPGDAASRDLSAPGALDAFLARPGLYVRAAQPDASPRFLADAIRSSAKDAALLCLLAPPESASDYDLTLAATRKLPGSPAFEEATRGVQRLETVQRGLRVLTPGWAEEVKAADPIGLRAFEGELGERTAEEIRAAKAWAAAAYLAIVIDELPAGMKVDEGGSALAESFRAPMLGVIAKKPHEARFAIYDIEARKPVIRARVRVDAEAFGARTGLAEAAAAQDCYLGMAARKVAQQI